MRQRPLELLAIAGLGIALALCVVFAFKILLVLFAGVLLALLLRPAASFLARITHVPVAAALAVIVVLSLGAVVVTLVVFAPTAAKQLHELADSLPRALASLEQRIDRSELAAKTGAKSQLADSTHDALSKLPAWAAAALGGSIELVSSFVLIFFVAIYGAAEPEVYLRAALAITPERLRPRVTRAVHATAHDLTRWLVGRMVAMLFVGVTTSIAFLLFEVPVAIILGIAAGLLTFVEYIGAVASAIPPVLLVLGQGRTSAALGLLVLYTVLHVVEGYVLTPLLARAAVRIPPAIGIGFQALLATLAGPLALTFATPLLAAGISSVKAWRERE